MIRHSFRRIVALVALVSLGAGATVAAAADEAPTALDVPSIIFFGGGWGHGIGMSQFGAYGRAVAGHSYTDILSHYYADTTIGSVDGYGTFGAADDVDVLITTHTTAAIEPLAGSGTVDVSGQSFPVAGPVQATIVEGKWSVMVDGTDLCTDICADLTELSFTSGGAVVLKDGIGGATLGNASNGVNGQYSGGRIVLHPGALGGGCGGGSEFCIIHADLDLQHYLLGIAEIPTAWPAAAQRAQAVAARSYAASAILRRAGDGRAWDLDDSTQDQYYVGDARLAVCGNWCQAVADTDNQVVIHDGIIAETYYSASNGGHSAEPPDVWANGSSRPYLPALPDKFDGNSENPYTAKEYVYPLADVSRWFNSSADERLHVGTIRGIEIDGPASGRVSFATVTIHGTEKTSVIDGALFYSTLQGGCQGDQGCDPLRTPHFEIRRLISFIDVEYDDYFFLPVQWMTIEGLTTGTTPETFGSEESNTRAQLATFLWRFSAKPTPTEESGFIDVPPDTYFTTAVQWLKETGITTGVSAGEFDPEGAVTRAQAAAFLWRFAGEPSSDAQHLFVDVPDGRYFTEAVRWMVEHGITTGTTPTTFSPDALLTRAQIATFLWRLAGVPEAFDEGGIVSPLMRTS